MARSETYHTTTRRVVNAVEGDMDSDSDVRNSGHDQDAAPAAEGTRPLSFAPQAMTAVASHTEMMAVAMQLREMGMRPVSGYETDRERDASVDIQIERDGDGSLSGGPTTPASPGTPAVDVTSNPFATPVGTPHGSNTPRTRPSSRPSSRHAGQNSASSMAMSRPASVHGNGIVQWLDPSQMQPQGHAQGTGHHHQQSMNQSIANSAFSIPQSVVSFSSAYAPSSYVPPSRTPSRPGTARSRSSSVPDLPSAFPAGLFPGGQLPEANGSGAGLGSGSNGNGLRERPRTSVRESFAAPPPKPSYPRHSFARTRNSSAISGSGTGAFTHSRDSKPARPKSTALNLHGDHGEGKETDVIEKPWLEKRDPRVRTSWWLTFCLMFLGVAASGVRVYFGRKEVPLMSGNLCLVMDDEFDKGSIDQSIWGHEVDMGGFGNGEFEMTTTSTNNSFVQDGILYITPTLTRDVIGSAAIFDGHTFNLTGCTNTNLTACGAVSNATTRTVINPVQSARLNTRNSTSIQFGRVEVRARMPRGDWLWPAIWMLPVDNSYGPWPLSGEMDIVEARGNGLDYPKQGRNYVRASLNWGPLSWLNEVAKTFGFWFDRRKGYDEEFHTYALEWTSDFVRMYVDSRLNRMYDLRFTEPFFNRGNFPPTVFNGTQEIPIPNPWLGASNAAPFDKPFYLIMNVAVGGTNGWFPDGAGDKPWLDGSTNAMYDFANNTDIWYATWPTDLTRRSLAVDYVKMWKQC